MTIDRVMFLAWESPWPAYGGGSLRTLGLLQQLTRVFDVNLLVLSRCPLTASQTQYLCGLGCRVKRLPLRDISYGDKLRTVCVMAAQGLPYHCAVLRSSFFRHPDVLDRIRNFPGVVYASYGHWGTLTADRHAANWILDQQNADIDFWRVYASQTISLINKLAARVNWRLAAKHFRQIYGHIEHVVSVCDEDKQITLTIAPHLQVDVIENGVDCSYMLPNRAPHEGPPRILFTGTSAARNVRALRWFVRNVFPTIQRELPEAELLVGGNFSVGAQAEFVQRHNIRFTGRVDDMRPIFNQGDVYIAPFEETHGSKLKVAEAMAMGMPIVSTPAGIRGFALVDGESVLIASSDQQFAERVVALLRDPMRREFLGAAARRVAVSTIDWAVLGQRLVEIVYSVKAAV
jgi:glycosyltransferase involved in cell wall biosynthesis